MAIRSFGKVAFMKLKDTTGTIQLYIKKDEISEKEFQLYKLLDIGDIIGVEGPLFLTKTNLNVSAG